MILEVSSMSGAVLFNIVKGGSGEWFGVTWTCYAKDRIGDDVNITKTKVTFQDTELSKLK